MPSAGVSLPARSRAGGVTAYACFQGLAGDDRDGEVVALAGDLLEDLHDGVVHLAVAFAQEGGAVPHQLDRHAAGPVEVAQRVEEGVPVATEPVRQVQSPREGVEHTILVLPTGDNAYVVAELHQVLDVVVGLAVPTEERRHVPSLTRSNDA